MHILLIGASRLLCQQRVVGTPIGQRRIEIFAILVMRESARLPHQPNNDVAIINGVLVLTTQTRHPLHHFPGVPDLDVFQADPRFHLLADQACRHRVGVLLHANRATPANGYLDPFQRFQPSRRHRSHARQLLLEFFLATGVAPRSHLLDQRPILFTAGKIAATTQLQRLLHRHLEMSMRRFRVAVLVAAVRIGRLGLDTVMIHQTPVFVGELLRLTVVMHCQGHAVRAMACRHQPHFPDGVLITRAQRREILAETQRHRLPVRIGQHVVIKQVWKRHSGNRHVQVVHRREIRCRQPPRLVHLREEQFLGRPMLCLPLPHPPLERPPRLGRAPPGHLTLHPLPQRLGLQIRRLL
jgi:hypothetical protein